LHEQNAISNGRGPEHVAVLLGRLRLAWLLNHFPPRVVWAFYIFINGFLTMGKDKWTAGDDREQCQQGGAKIDHVTPRERRDVAE